MDDLMLRNKLWDDCYNQSHAKGRLKNVSNQVWNVVAEDLYLVWEVVRGYNPLEDL